MSNRPMRVALFAGCLVDGLFPDIGMATATLLRRLGCNVEFPGAQTCCGQMHLNSGHGHLVLPIVEHHRRVFECYDAVVSPSASCVASVRHHHPAVAEAAGLDTLVESVSALGQRTWDLATFLCDVLEVEDVGARFPGRVTYHPTCHSLRTLCVGDRPLRLLRAVDGLDLVELPHAESCCGFGGTFAVKNDAVSAAMLGDKIDAIEATGASACVAVDASCLMHLAGGLRRRRSIVRPVHLAEVLSASA